VVHDLLQEEDGGRWQLRASAYRKLRLPVPWMEAALRAAGFGQIECKPAGRLTGLIARL
jgi:hypothetical protein